MNVRATDFVFQTVNDIDTSIAFYRDTLGLTVEVLDEESGQTEFALPPTTLALVEADPRMPMTPGEGGTGIALAVEDLESTTEELRDEGVPIRMEPHEFEVCHMSMIADPDGHPLVLHERKDGTAGRVDPFP